MKSSLTAILLLTLMTQGCQSLRQSPSLGSFISQSALRNDTNKLTLTAQTDIKDTTPTHFQEVKIAPSHTSQQELAQLMFHASQRAERKITPSGVESHKPIKIVQSTPVENKTPQVPLLAMLKTDRQTKPINTDITASISPVITRVKPHDSAHTPKNSNNLSLTFVRQNENLTASELERLKTALENNIGANHIELKVSGDGQSQGFDTVNIARKRLDYIATRMPTQMKVKKIYSPELPPNSVQVVFKEQSS